MDCRQNSGLVHGLDLLLDLIMKFAHFIGVHTSPLQCPAKILHDHDQLEIFDCYQVHPFSQGGIFLKLHDVSGELLYSAVKIAVTKTVPPPLPNTSGEPSTSAQSRVASSVVVT